MGLGVQGFERWRLRIRLRFESLGWKHACVFWFLKDLLNKWLGFASKLLVLKLAALTQPSCLGSRVLV